MVTNYKKWEYSYEYYFDNIRFSQKEAENYELHKEKFVHLNRYAMHCYSYIEDIREEQLPNKFKLSLAESRMKSRYGLEFLNISNELGKDLNDIELERIYNKLNEIIVTSLNVISYLKENNMLGSINENTEAKEMDFPVLISEDKKQLQERALDMELI